MPSFADQCVPTGRKALNKSCGFSNFSRPDNILVACIRSPVTNVFENAGREQRDVLVNQRDGGAQCSKSPCFKGLIAPQDTTTRGFSKTQQETDEAGFPCPR